MEERPLRRNDPCHCGSRIKYKHCHMREDLETGRRYLYRSAPIQPLRDLTSLRNNTLDFIACLKAELGITIDERTGKGAVENDISDGVIRRTYGRLPFFFPHTAPYASICGSLADKHVSGFYWGSSNVNSIATHLVRYALYTPHIIISNPFCDMMRYHMDVSPLDQPGAWRQTVVNKAIFLASIDHGFARGSSLFYHQ